MECTSEEIANLHVRYGDRVFILDLERFAAYTADFLQAFRRRHTQTLLGYSVKTNYIPQVCAEAASAGAWMEVVSEMELEWVLAIGATGAGIMVNGPYKSDLLLDRSMEVGARIHVDSLDELQRLLQRQAGRRVDLGLRICLNAAELGDSRFGVYADGPDLIEMLRLIAANPLLQLTGLHFHGMPAGRRPQSYQSFTEQMVRLATDLRSRFPIRWLNMGGGFYGPMAPELAKSFDAHLPSFDDYAEAIAGTVQRTAPWLTLFLEPGLCLTGNVMSYACRVSGIKQRPQVSVVQTGGTVYDIKPTLHRRDLPFQVISTGQSPRRLVSSGVMTGSSCMEGDILCSAWSGEIAVGDSLLFSNVGAYTVVLSPTFIREPAPIVFKDRATRQWKVSRPLLRGTEAMRAFLLSSS